MSHALAIIPAEARDETEIAQDPIFAAIAQHRAAAVQLENAVIALDRVTTHPANQRTPMTIAAMARADTVRYAAGVDEQTAWEAIWELEPQTFGALMVASRYASDAGAERGYPDAAAVFGLIAKHLQRLICDLPEGTPENTRPASAEYMAAMDFEPYTEDFLDDLPTPKTWNDWAQSHLVTIRIAGALLTKSRKDLHESNAALLAEGEVGERFLDDLKQTTDWASGLHALLDTAYTRVLSAASAAGLREAAGEDLARGDEVGTGAEPAPPRGYVPGVEGAHPGSYGLTIEAAGAGLRMPPGSVVIVEPVPPKPNGLAVVYFKSGGTPKVFDLDRHFRPSDLLYHPDSTVFPLIEMIEPISGQYGRVDVRRIDKMHRVLGVYQSVEVSEKYGPDVPVLAEFTRCPTGMVQHQTDCAAAYPILRVGETAIADPSRRNLRDGGLFLIEWSNGTRSVLLTNQRDTGGVEGAWWVDPVNRPRTRELLEMRLAAGAGLMFTSDGPYTLEHLQEKIVGEVVGVLVPGAPDDGERQPLRGDSGSAAEEATLVDFPQVNAGAQATDAPLGSPLSLADMISQWQALGDRINSDELDDEALDPLGEEHTNLQMAIYAFPAGSVADLLAKVPVFRDEMEDAARGLANDAQTDQTLAGAAWLGLFRDFERLATGGHPHSVGAAA